MKEGGGGGGYLIGGLSNRPIFNFFRRGLFNRGGYLVGGYLPDSAVELWQKDAFFKKK